MSIRLRAALVGGAAALAALVVSASAHALTVSPSGAYTLTSTGSVVITFTSNGQRITCDNVAIPFTVDGSGAGSSAVGTPTFRRCTNVLIPQLTLSSVSAWGVNIVLTSGLVGIRFGVPTSGWRFAAATGGCSFVMGGTFTPGTSVTALPATITTTAVFSVLSSAVTTNAVSSCSPLLTVVGLSATVSGSFSLDRPMTVSG